MTRPPLAQPPRRFAHAVEHALQVDGDVAIEEVVVGLRDRRQLHDAGVVDQHVDAAVRLLGGVEHRAHRGGVAHVGLHRARAAPGLSNLRDLCIRFGALPGEVDDDGEAVACEALREGGADAARGAGDNGGFSVGW